MKLNDVPVMASTPISRDPDEEVVWLARSVATMKFATALRRVPAAIEPEAGAKIEANASLIRTA